MTVSIIPCMRLLGRYSGRHLLIGAFWMISASQPVRFDLALREHVIICCAVPVVAQQEEFHRFHTASFSPTITCSFARASSTSAPFAPAYHRDALCSRRAIIRAWHSPQSDVQIRPPVSRSSILSRLHMLLYLLLFFLVSSGE